MKLQIKKGSTDVSIYVFVPSAAVGDGSGLTGLAYNSSGLTCYYVRPLGSATQLTLATQTVTGAHSDGGFVEVSSANMPGVYRLDLSDAIVASGANSVVVMLKGATNMVPVLIELELVAYDPQDSVRLGLTALPNAAAEAAGGLYTRGTGAGQIEQNSNGRISVNVEHWNNTAVPAEHTAGYPVVTIKDGTGTGEIDTNAGAVVNVTNVTNLTNAPTVGDLTATMKASVNAEVDAALNTAIPGSPTADSINERIKTLDDNYTSTRAGYLDNLNIGGLVASASNLTTVLNRIGAFTGSGVNTILGFFQALMRKDVTTPSDVGGTYDDATDSLEAIRDRGDAAWVTGGSASDVVAIKAKTDQLQFNSPSGGVDANVVDWGTAGITPSTTGNYPDVATQAIGANAVTQIWNKLTSSMTTAGSIGKHLVDLITGDTFGRLGAPAGASVSADIAAVKTDTAAIKTKTDQLTFTGSDVRATLDGETVTVGTNSDKTGYHLHADGADLPIKKDLTGITGESRRSILNAIRKLLNRVTRSVGSGTLTVYKEDDTTTAYTETTTTNSSAEPMTESNPD